VLKSIGNLDIRKLRGAARNSNLNLVGALKKQGVSGTISGLASGDYFIRVMQRKGNTQYQLKLSANPVSTSPTVSSISATDLSEWWQ
jgi:hypothetical protein